ncbi:sensor histidine kinase [Microbacterium invictum]|uniref:Two-component system sensor histidine kinase DesK n=1 Tax=Microbacterium invictum TaxID=515415 RepID=A0AA40SPC3_9MICO|nr:MULTISPECIES: sensor histidine kinase [Microbacterium]MBB4139854.1 two-component system sensor histidine kinase DesK [Microbacterium invictum]
MTDDATSGAGDGAIASAAGAAPAAWAMAGSGSGRRGTRSAWERYGWVMAAIWMVFLIYPLLALLRSEADPGWIVAGWIGLAAFVVIYVAGFVNGMTFSGGGLTSSPKPVQWMVLALLIVCALVTIPAVGGNALSFVPFIMSFASYGLTRAAHWLILVGGVGVTAAVVLLTPGGLDYISILAIVALLGVVNTVSTTLIIRSAQAERLGLELATSEGREAVARDVHDLIGHTLTVVRLKSQLARRLIDSDPEKAKAELADIEALTAEAIAGVRETVAGVRSATLADQLVSCRGVLQGAGIALRVDGEVGALSPAQSLTAGWILREATTNILRHASAGAVTVRIAPGRFTVIDDGVGFGGAEGNGVRGMRERASTAGATLTVTAEAEGGTRVEVTW